MIRLFHTFPAWLLSQCKMRYTHSNTFKINWNVTTLCMSSKSNHPTNSTCIRFYVNPCNPHTFACRMNNSRKAWAHLRHAHFQPFHWMNKKILATADSKQQTATPNISLWSRIQNDFKCKSHWYWSYEIRTHFGNRRQISTKWRKE